MGAAGADREPAERVFSASVRREQTARGSREILERMRFGAKLTPALIEFVSQRDSVYLGTASLAGQPYIQHRGGRRGFIHAIGENQLAFADHEGNRQYVTIGNLAENPQAFLFMMDYENRRRVKFWGEARVVEDDPEFVERLATATSMGMPRRAIVFAVAAFDVNCPRHIPRRIDAADALARLQRMQEEIDALARRNGELEAELARLRNR